MEINSFTSEPQYQRPDERNDVVHYIPKPVPPPAMDQGMGGAMGAMTGRLLSIRCFFQADPGTNTMQGRGSSASEGRRRYICNGPDAGVE